MISNRCRGKPFIRDRRKTQGGKWRIQSWAHSWFKLLQDKVFFPSMWHQCNLSPFKPSVGSTIYSSCIEFCAQHMRRIMWKQKAYRQTHQINTLTMNSELTYVGYYYYFRNYFSCLHIHILNSLQCVWGKTQTFRYENVKVLRRIIMQCSRSKSEILKTNLHNA